MEQKKQLKRMIEKEKKKSTRYNIRHCGCCRSFPLEFYLKIMEWNGWLAAVTPAVCLYALTFSCLPFYLPFYSLLLCFFFVLHPCIPIAFRCGLRIIYVAAKNLLLRITLHYYLKTFVLSRIEEDMKWEKEINK